MSVAPEIETHASPRTLARPIAAALRVATLPETVTVALLALAFVAGSAMSPYFLDGPFLLNSTSLYMETGLMALAMTFVIVSGSIDLSVASNLALSAVLVATLHAKGVPMAVAAVLGPIIGGGLGLLNGLAITRLRLPSLTITLGTLALYRGLAQVLAGDRSIGGFPDWFAGINYRFVGIVPLPLILFFVCAMVFGVALRKTTFGRAIYAIGTNEAAARFSGLRVDRVKVAVFTISGAMAGAAAVVAISRLNGARYSIATGNDGELAVITAVVLGGAAISGGRGGVFGTVVAIFLLGTIRIAMETAGQSAEAQLTATGTLLVISVLLARVSAWAGGKVRQFERRRNDVA